MRRSRRSRCTSLTTRYGCTWRIDGRTIAGAVPSRGISRTEHHCGARPPGALVVALGGQKSARGARAPHEQTARALLQCGARPPGAPAAQMWGATAGRAVVPLGGQEEARAARAPHTNKAGRCFSVGRDHQARLPLKCGARPPGALSLRSEGKKKRARRARPTLTKAGRERPRRRGRGRRGACRGRQARGGRARGRRRRVSGGDPNS